MADKVTEVKAESTESKATVSLCLSLKDQPEWNEEK